MHKVGVNDTNDDYSYEDSNDSEQNEDEITTRILHNPLNSDGYSNSRTFNAYSNSNSNMHNGGFTNHNNWNASSNRASIGIQRDNSNNFQNPFPGYSSKFDNNRTNANKNQTEQDRACLVHCFFHELKMVIIKCKAVLGNLPVPKCTKENFEN